MRSLLITIMFSLAIGAGGTYAWLYFGGFSGEKETAVAFVDAYGNYADIADRVETLVHVPTAGGNDSREELHKLLSTMLTDAMDTEKRESLARIAFVHLDTIKKEIDAAQAVQASLYQVLQDFDNAARSFSGIDLGRQSMAIVGIARKRAEISSRITSILSETNEQTYAIITRILAEKGALSPEHITEINAATADAEKRFDTLAELYAELVTKHEELERAFGDFIKDAI